MWVQQKTVRLTAIPCSGIQKHTILATYQPKTPTLDFVLVQVMALELTHSPLLTRRYKYKAINM